MKKWFSEPKVLFTLLMVVAILAIVAGIYLTVALGMQGPIALTALSALGMLMWIEAWSVFVGLCHRLRKGESAFTASTGKALRLIGWCMVGLAVVALVCALISGTREAGFLLIERVILPGFFLSVGMAAKILRDLLTHAMNLEAEQEGVV